MKELFIAVLYSFLSKLKITWAFPFITYAMPTYKVTGEETQKILDLVEPGDIILRGYYGYCNKLVLNGTIFTHVGLIIDKKNLIHAFAPEVRLESIIHFCRTDYITVVRPLINYENREEIIKLAIERAHEYLGTLYDFQYNFDNDGNVCCTELVANCYKEYRDELGMKLEKFKVIPHITRERTVIQPDAILKYGKNNKIIFMSKHAKAKVKKIISENNK